MNKETEETIFILNNSIKFLTEIVKTQHERIKRLEEKNDIERELDEKRCESIRGLKI